MCRARRYYIRIMPQWEGARQYFAGPFTSRAEARAAMMLIRGRATWDGVVIDPEPLSHTAAQRAGMRKHIFADPGTNVVGLRLPHDPADIESYVQQGLRLVNPVLIPPGAWA